MVTVVTDTDETDEVSQPALALVPPVGWPGEAEGPPPVELPDLTLNLDEEIVGWKAIGSALAWAEGRKMAYSRYQLLAFRSRDKDPLPAGSLTGISVWTTRRQLCEWTVRQYHQLRLLLPATSAARLLGFKVGPAPERKRPAPVVWKKP